MKTVFTDISHIAHLWANKLQETARNSGNFYFNGDTIFSYGRHFPIAKHVVNERGENCVLFTERTYSNTTAGHISIVRQAANHKNIVYCYSPESTSEENFNYWLRCAESTAKKLLNARKPEKYLSELDYIKSKVKKYCDFFSLTIPESLVAALNIGNKSQFAEYQNKKDQYEKEESERKAKELEKKHKKELKAWKDFKVNRLYNRIDFDFLRLNQSENRIETTQAVQIPFEIGKRIYFSILDNSISVGDKVLNFEVLEVGKNIKIGCHNFKREYLLKFGAKIFTN